MDGDKTLLKAFIQNHPADAARILEGLTFEETASFLSQLSPALSAEILKHLDPATASLCLERLNLRQTVDIIIKLPLDIVSLILRRVEGEKRKAMLSELPPQISKQVSLILRNGEGTAGAIMDTQLLTLPDDITIKEALKRTRRYPEHQIQYIYILNRKRILAGFVTTSQLLSARPSNPVASIMTKPVYRLSPSMTRQAILANPGWHELHTLPVVDGSGIFLGVIGHRTLHKLEMMTEKTRPHWRGEGISSAFGELYLSGFSAYINEMVLAVRGERAEPAGQKKR